jgi:hypothetical protein
MTVAREMTLVGRISSWGVQLKLAKLSRKAGVQPFVSSASYKLRGSAGKRRAQTVAAREHK